MKISVDPRGVFAILAVAYAVIVMNWSLGGLTVTKDSFIIGALALTFVMAITSSEK